MTDNEIVKALGFCDSYFDCDGCPCEDVCGGLSDLSANTLDLINRQKAEIEELKCRNQDLTSDLTSAKAENERLEEMLDSAVSSERNLADAVLKGGAE